MLPKSCRDGKRQPIPQHSTVLEEAEDRAGHIQQLLLALKDYGQRIVLLARSIEATRL